MRKALLTNVVMPAAAAITPFKSWAYMHRMCGHEFESLHRQRLHVMHQIREMLVHAYREVDVYRAALERAHIDPVGISSPQAFAAVPITTKLALRSGFPDRQVARSSRGKPLRYSRTSGTTGPPLMLVQDFRDSSHKYASVLRSRVLAGVAPMASQVQITPQECQPCAQDPSRVEPGDGNGGGLTSILGFLERQVLDTLVYRRKTLDPFWPGSNGSAAVEYDRYIEQIRAFGPDVLTILPLYAVLLCKHIRRTGTAPPPVGALIDLCGSLCTPAMTSFVSQTLGTRVAQSCGGCELGRYGASCTEDVHRMHLAESYAYIEAVRPDGELCAPGELGNLIATSLHSWAMPLIRMEPGDVGRIVEAPCRCGRRSRRLQHAGRIQALVRNADGRFVPGADFWNRLLLAPGVELFQLRQLGPEEYELDLVPEPDRKPDMDEVDAALAELLGTTAVVKRRLVPGIGAERSGQIQLVKSCTYEEFRVASVRVAQARQLS